MTRVENQNSKSELNCEKKATGDALAVDDDPMLDSANWDRLMPTRPTTLELLVTSSDDLEATLVQNFLDFEHMIVRHVQLAKECWVSDDAASQIKFALDLCAVLIEAAQNILDFRHHGTQRVHVVRTSGPTVGVGAKLDNLRRPQPNTPDWLLLEFVENVARLYRVIGDHFDVQAELTRLHVGDLGYARQRQIPVATEKEVGRWSSLAAKAYEKSAMVHKGLIKMQRARSQVIVVNERPDIAGMGQREVGRITPGRARRRAA